TDATCNNVANGTATITAAGGTSPYSYTLGTSVQTTGSFTALAAGTYDYSVTDANNCAAATGTVVIGQPAAITASAIHTDATCNNVANGTATITAAGGTSPYSYTLGTSVQTTGSFTALAAGTYDYSVTDANNCAAATGTVVIGQPAAITASAIHTDATCNNVANGTATITAAGGTSPYSYTLGTSVQTTGSF